MIVGTVSTLALIYLSPTIQIDILQEHRRLVPAAESGHRHDSAVVRRRDRRVAAAAGAVRGAALRRARAAAAPRCRVSSRTRTASGSVARSSCSSRAARGRGWPSFVLAAAAPSLPAPGSETYEQMTRAFYRGLAALEVGLLDDARQQFTTRPTLVPEEPAAWANLG